MTRAPMLRLAIVTALGLSVALQAQTTGSRDEDFARRQYDSGMSFMRDQLYAEALKDFQAVASGFPNTSVADDALLQMALYQLDIAGDRAAAQTTVDQLLKSYPDADSAPMGYVLSGRLTVAGGRSANNIESALASFERVPRLFPMSGAVPAALYHAGETLRIARRDNEALERFRRVGAEYPQSIWAARATLASGHSLVQSSRVTGAFDAIQRIRRQFPNTPEAVTALDYNTLLYRLYVRSPAQPAYSFNNRYVGGTNLRFRDVIGLRALDSGNLLVGHRAGVAILDPKGAIVREIASQEPSAFFVDDSGKVTIARRENLVVEGAQPVLIQAPESNGRFHVVDQMPSIAVLSNGERLVADRQGEAVIRLSPTGEYVSTFARIDTDRIALSRTEDVAIVDRDSKAIT
ncbi:MAG: tetratricopeptide repeat protein, partial [Vicinamibacterales bacterium]